MQQPQKGDICDNNGTCLSVQQYLIAYAESLLFPSIAVLLRLFPRTFVSRNAKYRDRLSLKYRDISPIAAALLPSCTFDRVVR